MNERSVAQTRRVAACYRRVNVNDAALLPPRAAPETISAPRAGSRFVAWLRAHPFLIVLVIAIGVRVALHAPHPIVPGGNDPARFVYQAERLLAGEGFLWRGKPCTNLPPGYPVFIAIEYAMKRSNDVLLAVQFTLSVASCALLYFALKPRRPRIAWLASALFAVHFWSAYYCWQVMSECLGAFLVTLLCWLVSRLDAAHDAKVRHLSISLSIGLVVSAAVLTSPSVIVLVYAVLGAAILTNLRRPWSAIAMLVGFVVLMAPWQIHCYRVLGRVVPQVLDTNLHTTRGLAMWQRTWIVRTMSPHRSAWGYFLWDTPGSTIDQVPDRAFRSEEERTELQRKAEGWKARGTSIVERERTFEPIAAERIAESPLAFHIGLPLVRSALMWLEMPNVAAAKLDLVGKLTADPPARPRASGEDASIWPRIGEALFSNVAFAVHATFLVAGLVLCIGALVSRRVMGLAFLLGVVGYTFVSAYLAISEFRRNIPFIPVVLFLAYYWPSKGRARDSTRSR